MLAALEAGPSRGAAPSRVLCIDGPSGSGKSTLARAVAGAAAGAVVVELDELLDGWDGGLPRMVSALVHDVLAPLSAGRPAAYRRFDWVRDRFAERVPVPARPLVVVEGVGAGSRLTAPYRAMSVWVEAPRALRLRRGLDRDGDAFAPHWEAWAAREDRHFSLEGTRSRADLVLRTG